MIEGFLIYRLKNFERRLILIRFQIKVPWKTLIVLIIGLVAAVGSLQFQKQWVAANQETVQVPVPAHKISANTIIKPEDLAQKKYIKAALNDNVVVNAQKVIGKAAVTDLYPGELILKTKLKEKLQVLGPGEVFVTVKADSLEQVLGGNICRNMVVDVIYTEETEKPPVLLAENAVVVSVLDENGKAMSEPVNVAQAAVSGITGRDKTPKYIMLKVKRNESYEFTRPLNGGHILITQVGDVQPEPVKVPKQLPKIPEPENKEQADNKAQPEDA